ncbi:MAG TPA: stalk domain-containing protein [Syntrophomonadaceae bacterium]|nr:stalk domain-containing protein [Syntrophomonadaceae bacterium]HQA06873.1 stalk domain-containing protein [Syntrophomonadaceae bacterium]HQE22825.1 stalk domain-containing protein [Syntrophomonadaceae bacterium]
MGKKTLTISILLALIISIAVAVPPAIAQPDTVVIYIEGKPLESEVPPVIRGDRTMVPLRAICEGLGLAVQWDAENYFVLISSNESNLVAPPGEVGSPQNTIRIFFNGYELKSKVAPFILNNRTMVPIRIISEEMGMKVDWNPETYEVYISWPEPEPTLEEPEQLPVANLPEENSVQEEPLTPPAEEPLVDEPEEELDMEVPIMGQAQASAEQLRSLLYRNNPDAPDLVDLYLQIGAKYGVRGDLAFCQAAKETGWWRFTGIVQPWQNNYCGLAATGVAATGEEDLLGADPSRVRYEAGVHGAIFATPADGVEAQIQHLYAYATSKPLPDWANLVDPRFKKVTRGCAPRWIDLGGKWAYPGYDRNKYPGENGFEEAFANQDTYGHSIIKHYYAQMF